MFDRAAWLAAHGLALATDERLVSVFCYPGAPVDRLVGVAGRRRPPDAARHRARRRDRRACARRWPRPAAADRALRQHALPWLPQADFDRLLWAADLNFVRGEDSWVRAQWAGRPFVWQAYPQDDGAHAPEDRGLPRPGAGGRAGRRRRTRCATGRPPGTPSTTPPPRCRPGRPRRWPPPAAAPRAWRDQLMASADLVARLLAFVARKALKYRALRYVSGRMSGCASERPTDRRLPGSVRARRPILDPTVTQLLVSTSSGIDP